MSDAVRTFTVTFDDDGIRLDRWFKRNLPDASFNLVSRWARTGQLRVDGKRATPGDRIVTGQSIRVPPAEPVVAVEGKPAPALRPKKARPELSEDETAFAESLVIHKDDAALVLNKPPGLATQGGTKTDDMLTGCSTRCGMNRTVGPSWFTGSIRIHRAR
jgi:23S rRNA pseudouridine955/2504/2580 synthase